MSERLLTKLRMLSPEFMRFALVGGAATLVHAGVYAAIIAGTTIHPQLANVAGFVSALGISLFGHHHFTFRADAGKRDMASSSWRLVVAALLGYLLNAFFVYLVSDILAADPRMALIPMIGITPLATYLINRNWVFYRGGVGLEGGSHRFVDSTNTGSWLPDIVVAAFSCAVGLTVFLLFGGRYMIDPGNTEWLMYYDPSQHYMGWAFFRHTPLLQFPLGVNPLFGDSIASSIVFSDSIPLFAFPFKLANALLPQPFQYFGLWIAFCLCMQVYFALRILRQIGLSPEAAGLGAILFVFSPVLLWRLHGHEALLAHWLLLAGISLYLDRERRDGAWVLLLLVAVLVHAYLFVMVGGIWFADACGRWLGWHGDQRPSLFGIIAPVLACPLAMWVSGYFMGPPPPNLSAWEAGFGFHRAELPTFFDPDEVWSWLLPDIPDGLGGDAGFAFLGLGACALLILAGAVCIRRLNIPMPPKRFLALILLATLFAIFAFSNRIAIADETYVWIATPRLLDPLLITFRASGRFIWLPAYLILLALVVFAARCTGRRAGAAILLAAVVLQVVDLQPAMAFFRQKLSTPWQNPAESAFWPTALQKYRRIVLAPADSQTPIYLPMAMLAAENGVAINVAYLARHDAQALAAEQARVVTAAETGALDPNSLYVFSSESLFQKAVAAKPAGGLAGKVDGFSILAPSWDGCTETCGLMPVP